MHKSWTSSSPLLNSNMILEMEKRYTLVNVDMHNLAASAGFAKKIEQVQIVHPLAHFQKQS